VDPAAPSGADPLAGLDPDTVGRARAGDREALGRIFVALNPPLLRFLGTLRVPDPDDTAADVWVDLARRMPAVDDDPVSLRRLLFTIGRRRAIDARRRRLRRREELTGELPAVPVPAGTDALDDRLFAYALLARLPAAQAEVVALRFVAGLSAAEVGLVTRRTEGAVRVMTLRALRQLRALLPAAGGQGADTDVTDPAGETMVES
jgi:RNA polymerase sigma-70 factor (ECF subfamily)